MGPQQGFYGAYLQFVWVYYSARDTIDIKNSFRYDDCKRFMDKNLYPMIFKRKSFLIFKDIGTIHNDVLTSIERIFCECEPLIPEIKTGMKIVPAEQAT